MKEYLDAEKLQEYTTKLVEKLKTIFPGAPTAVLTAAEMTDHGKIYVYAGTETGYVAGDWYYWNGSAWADGGVYNATALVTDPTLSIAGRAADAEATGDAVADLKSALNIVSSVNWILPSDDIIQGSYSNSSTAPGKWVDNSARIRNNGFISVLPGYRVFFTPGTNAAGLLMGQFRNGTLVRDTQWYTAKTYIEIPDNVDAIILVFKKANETDSITPNEYDAEIIIDTISGNKFAQLNDILTNDNIINLTINGVSTDSRLFNHEYSSGDKINVRCEGYKCNLIGRKKSDNSIITLINNLLPSDDYTEYTFTNDVVSLGIYNGDATKQSTIYLFDGEANRLYNELKSFAESEDDLLDNKKVNGLIVWNENTETTGTDGKLVYGALNSTISEYTYATGNYVRCAINGNPKVRVKGYGWEQASNFALWAFTDANGKILSRDTIDGHTATTWLEITDIPAGAAYCYVNGNNAIHASIEVAYYSTDFVECYDAVRDRKFGLITLGDSITKLGITDRGWIKYFIEKTGATLIANVAVDGAQLVDKEGTAYDGNPTESNPTNNVLGNQVQKVINNNYTAPDLIMIAVGTNNGIFITAEQIKAEYYDNSNVLVPLADVDSTTGAGAYRYCTETLHNLYPNAVIVWCAPIYSAQASRRMDQIEAWGESLEIATRYSGQIFIDTFRCGINGVDETVGNNGEYLYDGLHPNVKGAKKIGLYNASKISPFLGNLIKSGLDS